MADRMDKNTGATNDAVPPIEVVYALPFEQTIVAVAYRDGMTAERAVAHSGLLDRYPEIANADLVLGVNGVRVEDTETVRPGDRIEICRPLLADPRRMRFDLALAGKVMGRAGRRGN
jgi:uncharacterized protein